MKNFTLTITSILLFSLLLGCGSRSPNTEFYILDNPKQTKNVDLDFKNKIQFYEVKIPSYLDRPSIVMRNANNVQLDIATYYVWAESLDLGIERILKNILRSELAEYEIMLEQIPNVKNIIPQISLNILRFDSTMGSNSVLEAHWILFDKDGKIITQGFFHNQIPCGTDFDSLVKAQSQLLVQLGQAMVIPLSKVFAKTEN